MMVCVCTGLCEARPCVVGAVKGNLGSSGHKSEWMKGKETIASSTPLELRLDMETPDCFKHHSEWQMETHLPRRDGLS